MFSIITSFFIAMGFWLLFSLSLRFLSERTTAIVEKKSRESRGERTFHSPLLIMAVGMMSFFIFPTFLMLIVEKEPLAFTDMLYFTLFLITAIMSFFYFIRELGVRR